MALYLNTNIASLKARYNLNKTTDVLDTSLERLSSGYRINSAKDDAAGIQVSNRLTTQINALEQGNRNAQDCISYAQTAEGALDEITNMLQRIRTLSIQAATGSITNEDREGIQAEVDQMNQEITRIACQTTFAGQDLLNGKAGILYFQVGAGTNSLIEIDLTNSFTTDGLAEMASQINGDTFTVESIDPPNNVFKYTDIFKLDVNGGGIDVSTQENAEIVLAGIDSLIGAINSKRGELGSMQNRMEATIRNQLNVHENVSDSRSRIRDTDFAQETATLAQYQILQQSSATILTQANSKPQIALQLLQS